MPQINIKIEAFGAVERQLPPNVQLSCASPSAVSDVLQQLSHTYPEAHALIERCACAMGEDLISRQTQLRTDSTLVLLSPVAGG